MLSRLRIYAARDDAAAKERENAVTTLWLLILSMSVTFVAEHADQESASTAIAVATSDEEALCNSRVERKVFVVLRRTNISKQRFYLELLKGFQQSVG